MGVIKYEHVTLRACKVAPKIKREAPAPDQVFATFMRPGGYLRSQYGWRTVSTGKITFEIRTLKKNCLLLYSSSGWPKPERIYVFPRDEPVHPVSPLIRLTGTDVFSVELREGYLVFLLNTGSGVNEFATENIWRGDQERTHWFVADGAKHQVEIQLSNGSLSVTMDEHSFHMRPKIKPKYGVHEKFTHPNSLIKKSCLISRS